MRTIFDINDNTSYTKVIFYQKGENEIPIALKNFNYQSGQYVRIYGSIRVFKEEKAIVGNTIREVIKHDEVTNHFLQCFVSSNIRHKGVLKNKDLNGQGQGNVKGAPAAAVRGGAQGGDVSQVVLNFMKEICLNSRFAHK